MYVYCTIVWKDCTVCGQDRRDQEAVAGLWWANVATFPLSLLLCCVLIVIMMYHAMCSGVYIVALSMSIHEAAVAGDKETLSRLLPDATAGHLRYEAKVWLNYSSFPITALYYASCLIAMGGKCFNDAVFMNSICYLYVTCMLPVCLCMVLYCCNVDYICFL